jgi:hypothetical protein
MPVLTDNMAERCIAITKKFGLNYGDSYDELYAFIASLTPEQQDSITLTLIRGNTGCRTCNRNMISDNIQAPKIECDLFGVIFQRKCCHEYRKESP